MVRDLKLAAFQAIGPTPDGFEDTFTLDGVTRVYLTNDDELFGAAGINNEATVTVARRCEWQPWTTGTGPLPTISSYCGSPSVYL